VSPLASTVLSRVDSKHIGAVSGVLTTGLQVGNAIGVAVIGIIFYSTLRQPPANFVHAFGAALIYLIAMCLAVVGLVQLLSPRRVSGVPGALC
jgi:hypothetical protein